MSKEKVLHNFIKPRSKLSPYNYVAPSYDNRTSCSMKAGDEYGVGFKTPIGKDKASSYMSGPIPLGATAFTIEEVVNRDEAG